MKLFNVIVAIVFSVIFSACNTVLKSCDPNIINGE